MRSTRQGADTSTDGTGAGGTTGGASDGPQAESATIDQAMHRRTDASAPIVYDGFVRCAYAGSALLFAAGCYQVPDSIPSGRPDVPMVPDAACDRQRDGIAACTIDGDTFDLGTCGQNFGGERFRLLGINAPEIAHELPAECYGDIASAELNRLIANDEVILTFDDHCLDRYGRTLAYVWLVGAAPVDAPLPTGDTADTGGPLAGAMLVNEYLLANGFARLAPEDWNGGPLLLQDRLNAAEASARARGIGLWAACETPGS